MQLLKSQAEKYAKEAENYPFIFGSINLTSIRENIGEILKLIGREGIFREYTLHDANHIDEMLKLVGKLIPENTAAQMKVADWLMIVLSCYFHDLGMLVTRREFECRNECKEFIAFKIKLMEGDKGKDYEEALKKLTPDEREEFLYQEFVREHHAERIYDWIIGQDAHQFGQAKDAIETVNTLLEGMEKVFRNDLAKICLSHHENDLYDFDKYKISRIYGDDPQAEANLHYAALILRTTDVLQIQRKRVPPVLYKLVDPSNPKSQEEWAKQSGVRAIWPKVPSAEEKLWKIEVHASFEEENAYFGLLAYLQQFAGVEIDRCHKWAGQAQKIGSKYLFPWEILDSSQVEAQGFEPRKYSFQLEHEKILQLLTGHTLYNDYRVAIREVLQNALDAVRFRNHLFPDERKGKVDIAWDSKNRKLTVRDSGTGMTQETIEKFLLNVGSSYYQSEAVLQQHSDFSPISRFGIGILSTFMIADEVQILTVHPEEEFARRLTLPSVVKEYLIKIIPKGTPEVQAIGQHGTEVVLKVRRSAELNNVEDIIRYWLVMPNCEVTCKIDDKEPVTIGFHDAKSVLDYYYGKENKKARWKREFEIRTKSAPGIELSYVVTKSDFVNIWDFAAMAIDETPDTDQFLFVPPGMCIEGVRIRSTPAGYESRGRSPWIFANLTGRNAPKTNVARSDVEQNPELDRSLLQIYSLLADHIQDEFIRLREMNIGIAEAAFEADSIRTFGLERIAISSHEKFREAMSDIQIIALEDDSECRAVSEKDLNSIENIWSVDSRLVQNLESIFGILGIDNPASKIIADLGKPIEPVIPTPRILGRSKNPFSSREISKILIYPEERGYRIDICWGIKAKTGRWIAVPDEFLSRGNFIDRSGIRLSSILIGLDTEISSACPDYDIVIWRDWCLILPSSPIKDLFDIFGMNENFLIWLSTLVRFVGIPEEKRLIFKQQLTDTKAIKCADLFDRLVELQPRRYFSRFGSARWASIIDEW